MRTQSQYFLFSLLFFPERKNKKNNNNNKKPGEVGQEISVEKQKQSNMKTSEVWLGEGRRAESVCVWGGRKCLGSMWKKAKGKKKGVMKLSLHYQQHKHTVLISDKQQLLQEQPVLF